MPRNSNGVYSLPSGTLAASGATIESTKFNTLVQDIESDLNDVRPISIAGTGAEIFKQTRALLYADLAHDANTSALVYSDTTKEYNGIYLKSGASGAGSWGQITEYLPGYQDATATATSVGGTANAITATLTGYPDPDQAKRVYLVPTATNTSATVTITFNGGSAESVKSATGASLWPGAIESGRAIELHKIGSEWRVLFNVVGSELAVLSSIGGTANDITASVDTGVNIDTAVQLHLVPAADNTGPMTLTVGSSSFDILDPSGAALSGGEVVEEIPLLLIKVGSDFRIAFPANVVSQVQGYAEAAAASAASVSSLISTNTVYVDSYDTVASAVAEWHNLGANAVLKFGADTYTEDLTIQTNSTGQSIVGDGMYNTILQNISIEVLHSQCYLTGFRTEDTGVASASAGIKMNDATGARRDTFIRDIKVTGWDYGFHDADAGARVFILNCDFFLAGIDNFYLSGDLATASDQGDMTIANCRIGGALRYGINIVQCGTIMINNCKIQGNNVANVYSDVSGSTSYVCRQLMISNCSIENDGTWVGSSGRTFSITGFADNGDGTVRVTTSAAHKFQAGLEELEITGTTNYDGEYSIVDVPSTTTFDITATWVSNDATGSVSAPPWDIHLISGGSSRMNDISIDGGDANYVYIEGGINVKISSIVKRQLRLGANANGVSIFHQPMGRYDGAGVGSVLPLDVESGATFIRYGKSNPEDDSSNFESGGLVWQTEEGFYARFTVTIADDDVFSWKRPDGSNTRTIKTRVYSRNKKFHVEAVHNWVVPAGYTISHWDSSTGGDSGLTSSVDGNGGVYSGTTGADGKVTQAVQGGDTFYLENRSGGSEQFHIEITG